MNHASLFSLLPVDRILLPIDRIILPGECCEARSQRSSLRYQFLLEQRLADDDFSFEAETAPCVTCEPPLSPVVASFFAPLASPILNS